MMSQLETGASNEHPLVNVTRDVSNQPKWHERHGACVLPCQNEHRLQWDKDVSQSMWIGDVTHESVKCCVNKIRTNHGSSHNKIKWNLCIKHAQLTSNTCWTSVPENTMTGTHHRSGRQRDLWSPTQTLRPEGSLHPKRDETWYK